MQAWSRAALPHAATAQLDPGWLDDVIWDPGDLTKVRKGTALVQLDLNDASLIFEVPAGADTAALIERAAADIVVRDPTVRHLLLLVLGGYGLLLLVLGSWCWGCTDFCSW